MIQDPQRGDLIEIRWVDILEDPTGDPDEAELCSRTSYALFWSKCQSKGIDCIVTTTTRDHEATQQQGFCIYPSACVVAMKIIKKSRRKA